MNPSIYLITHYRNNHEPKYKVPLDSRFLQSDKNFIYYLIDKEIPEILQGKKIFQECRIDPLLHKAGGLYVAEWSFLLAEEKHAFCDYPFFTISSRFYEKNHFLLNDLNREWERLFSYLNHYGWGFLPSYDSKLKWIDLLASKKKKQFQREAIFFPFSDLCFEAINEIYKIDFLNVYRFMPYLFCNYIGFKSRSHLIEYVNFYKPLFHYFFSSEWQPKRPLENYVQKTGLYYKEKPFSFLVEFLSHLFFYKKKVSYFALHYDGYYEIGEPKKRFKKLHSFFLPKKLRLARFIKRNSLFLKNEIKRFFCFANNREIQFFP